MVLARLAQSRLTRLLETFADYCRAYIALKRFKFNRARTIKLRISATQACTRFAADCSRRCNQRNSGLNDSIQS